VKAINAIRAASANAGNKQSLLNVLLPCSSKACWRYRLGYPFSHTTIFMSLPHTC